MKEWLIKGRTKLVRDAKYRIDWNKKCASQGEDAVKQFLFSTKEYILWHEQYALPVYPKLYVDFLSHTPPLAIEIQSKVHDSYVKFFHKNRIGYKNSIMRDEKKYQVLQENGYKLIEIYHPDDIPNLSVDWFIKEHGIVL